MNATLNFRTFFLLAGLILFIIAAFPVSSRFNLVAAGLACVTAAAFFPGG